VRWPKSVMADVELFTKAGLSDAKAKETAQNEALAKKFREAILEVDFIFSSQSQTLSLTESDCDVRDE